MIQLIATSTMGLEAVVLRELQALGYAPKNVEVGRTQFEGTTRDICRANIQLRCAGHVLIQMGAFEAPDFGALFDQTTDLPWEDWLPYNAAFPVSGRSVKSVLSSVPACQKIVKKAIATRLERAYGRSLPENGAVYPIEVSILKDVAALTLDTTGDGLHRRGYRKLVGSAPLRETLAAALVKLSYWNPERLLADPFCGSGTIPIEAALQGRNIASGLYRHFAAEAWENLPLSDWKEARTEAADAILPRLPVKIQASDIDPEAVEMAQYHAQVATVGGDIEFRCRDFADLRFDEPYGCTIMNPPYGKWIGDHDSLRDLYESMPNVLRRLPTWSHYIYTAYPNFEKLLGQKADRRRKIYNSRLECTYYQFFGPRPPKNVESMEGEQAFVVDSEVETEAAVKPTGNQGEDAAGSSTERDSQKTTKAQAAKPRFSFGGLSDSVRNSAGDFERRLQKLAHHLRKFPKRGITCYRIYDRDIPEIPLAIDRYEDCLHIAEYERPNDRTGAQQAEWMELMTGIAGRVLEVPPEKIFLKTRRRQRGLSQYERFGERGVFQKVREGGLLFYVNLSDYLDTGLFLDHRNAREMVRREAAGKHVLNLFAYTGAFSVYAADGGAATVTTVDLSNTYLDWAEDNMHLNGFDDPNRYKYIKCDIRKFLSLLYDDEIYDLVVVDPPTFSNSKDLDVWDVQKHHVELLNALIPHVSPGGVIYFSTNHRKFKLQESELRGVSVREITSRTVPEDFRNKKIHRCWRLVVKQEVTE